jgi:uncharacterized protein (TIGR03437 family)
MRILSLVVTPGKADFSQVISDQATKSGRRQTFGEASPFPILIHFRRLQPMKSTRWYSRAALALSVLFVFSVASIDGQTNGDPRYYDIGSPVVTDIWVDPVNGNDSNNGSARSQALRTLAAAWNRIPAGAVLSGSGRRVMLAAGNYPESAIPNYLERRYGTASFPVIFQSADGRGKAILQGDLNIFDCRYLYLIDLTIRPVPAGDTLHFEQCDHILMRGLELDGGMWTGEGQSTPVAHETLKINQCQYIYLEESDIHGAGDNAVDYVAVQYGHVVGNRIHNCNDWAMYVKGGSAYLRIEANEFYDAGTGGFTTGQGTGFEFMTSPWLHYEAYDIKVINNVIHDTTGAGLGVNGGYNILMGWNTLYRVGRRSHLIEVVPGSRSCDGNTARCEANRVAGGWGTATGDGQYIPARNVFIYNNIVYNPAGYQSQWQHFEIRGPVTPPAGTNITSPARVDVNLQIRGNIIWNGPASHSLGLGSDTGCQPSNPTCNEVQIRADNAINTLEPQLIAPAAGDYRPRAGSNIGGVVSFLPGNFAWSDAPTTPAVPAGNPDNRNLRDRENRVRSAAGPAGAWLLPVTGVLSTVSAANYRATVAPESIVSGFGGELASGVMVATETPLPTSMKGASITVTDSQGTSRIAPLFFVSPGQINFLIPAGTASGRATLTLVNGSVRATGEVTVAAIAPGIFTADSSGNGMAAALALRVRRNQTLSYEFLVRVAATTGQLEAIPVDLGPEGEEVYLILFGTGWRNRTGITLTLGGETVPVQFSGGHSSLIGLDQLNVLIPRRLIGRGAIEVGLTVDGQPANPVRITIK